jgi:hypothetical protein
MEEVPCPVFCLFPGGFFFKKKKLNISFFLANSQITMGDKKKCSKKSYKQAKKALKKSKKALKKSKKAYKEQKKSYKEAKKAYKLAKKTYKKCK